MTSSLRRAPAALLLLLQAVLVRSAAGAEADDRVRALGDEFVVHWLRSAPHEATSLGYHATDGVLTPVTQVTLAADAAWLRDFRGRLEAISPAGLSNDAAIDRVLLAARTERALLDLEVIRPFERDPGAYLPMLAGSIESVLERPTAPLCQRLRMAARRLASVPEVLRAARINLRDPPRELTEAALDLYADLLRFYRVRVPALATACRDARTQADLAQADTSAVRAAEAFLVYLREDLLPASHGPLAIGPEACRRLMHLELLDEGLDDRPAGAAAPVESLLARARREVETRRAALESLAAEVGLGNAQAALDLLGAERPEAGELVSDLGRRLASVRAFLGAHEIATLPMHEVPGVREAPAFRGRLTLTGLRAPGPWDDRPLPAWLEVTPPEPSWDEGRREVHLAQFDRRAAELVWIHEAFPGRFLRGIALRGQRSRLRRALQSAWSAEDWGAYCERMMVDAGYGAGDPGYRIAVAARALRDAGRSYAALAIHAAGMPTAAARRMLEEQCLLDPDAAARETRRAAAAPAVMGYTEGARQLIALRDQAQQALGARFRIKAFNDAVLRYGGSPAGLVRACVRREMGLEAGAKPVGAEP